MMKTILKLAAAALASVLCLAMTVVTAALAIHAWRHADYAGAVGAGLMTVMSLLTGALYAFLAGSTAARIKEHHD
jgi:hypothetical protein